MKEYIKLLYNPLALGFGLKIFICQLGKVCDFILAIIKVSDYPENSITSDNLPGGGQ